MYVLQSILDISRIDVGVSLALGLQICLSRPLFGYEIAQVVIHIPVCAWDHKVCGGREHRYSMGDDVT